MGWVVKIILGYIPNYSIKNGSAPEYSTDEWEIKIKFTDWISDLNLSYCSKLKSCEIPQSKSTLA